MHLGLGSSEPTDLVGNLAGLLHTGSDAADKLGLLAVAVEVEELGATVAAKGSDEALKLEVS